MDLIFYLSIFFVLLFLALSFNSTSQKVVLGGGRQEFLTTAERDSEGASGKRTDGRNLINEWEDKHRRLRQNAQFVQTKEQLLNVSAHSHPHFSFEPCSLSPLPLFARAAFR